MPEKQNTTGDFCLEDSPVSFRLHWDTGHSLLSDVTIIDPEGKTIRISFADLLNITGMATSHIIFLEEEKA